MSNWRELLKEAKELFDDGLLDESEYKAEKIRIMALRSQSTNPGTTLPGRPPSIDTMGTMISQTPLTGRPDLGELDNLGTFVHQQTLSNIGNYKLLAKIGQGGMGTVYRARHTVEAFAQQTGDVVIKLMNPELASNPEFSERFISEAALGRSIRHPNFVEIQDVIVEQESNTLAIVMNLIDGQPLSDIIPKEGMEFEKAKPIVEQLCKAIDHLHSKGIIHRDLKPENIIVQRDGTPIILDMGIAKDTTDSNMSQTSTGTAMGTPLYMAPEQMDAKNVTSAADRYALGLIVYQLLSGDFPWSSTAGPAEILTKKFTGRLESLSQSEHFNRNAVMDLLHCEASKRPQTCEGFWSKLLRREETTEGNDVEYTEDTNAYEGQVSNLVASASEIGWNLVVTQPYTLNSINDLTLKVEQQLSFYNMIQDIREHAVLLDFDLRVPSPPWSMNVIEDLQNELEQMGFAQEVQVSFEAALAIGWKLEKLQSPFSKESVQQYQMNVDTQTKLYHQCQNGWGIPVPEFPLKKESVGKIQDLIKTQERLDAELKSLENELGMPHSFSKPYTKQNVTQFSERLSDVGVGKDFSRLPLMIVLFTCILGIAGYVAFANSSIDVQFTTSPSGAQVYVDNNLLCTTTPCTKSLEASSYTIRFEKDGYESVEEPFSPESSRTVEVHLSESPKATHQVYNTYQDEDEPWLNLRSQSDHKSKKLAALVDGTPLKMLDDRGKWAKVLVTNGEHKGMKGWVNTKWLK